MIDPIELGYQLFEMLIRIDERIVERAAMESCARCEGPLYRSDFSGKPRGRLLAIAVETFTRRVGGLCCSRDGYRRRATGRIGLPRLRADRGDAPRLECQSQIADLART